MLKNPENQKGAHMKILGIDPGYAIMGYGIVEMKGNHFSVCCHGAITTCAGTEMPLRLKYLYESLTEIIKEYKPEEAAIDSLTASRIVAPRDRRSKVLRGLDCFGFAID